MERTPHSTKTYPAPYAQTQRDRAAALARAQRDQMGHYYTDSAGDRILVWPNGEEQTAESYENEKRTARERGE